MTPHERLSCRVTLRLTVLYINTGWDQTERHHSKKVLTGPIPLNYQVHRVSPFSAFVVGALEKQVGTAPIARICISGGAQEIFRAVPENFLGGDGKAEEPKLPGAGIPPKPFSTFPSAFTPKRMVAHRALPWLCQSWGYIE
jgi:hypothetical protein